MRWIGVKNVLNKLMGFMEFAADGFVQSKALKLLELLRETKNDRPKIRAKGAGEI